MMRTSALPTRKRLVRQAEQRGSVRGQKREREREERERIRETEIEWWKNEKRVRETD